jgi:hypothetical protein
MTTYTFTSGQILTAADLNNKFSQTAIVTANADNITNGTLDANRLPYTMDQNVSTTSNVTFANVVVTGNLTVSGTTTYINTSNLDITDINITLAKGASSNASANTAGITIDFANAQIFYLNPANTWAFNRDLTPYTGNTFSLGNTTARWVIQANTINSSGLITGSAGADITGTANASSAMYVGANSYMNLTTHFVGNSTVNTNIQAGVVTVNGAFVANNSGAYHTGVVNALTIQASATFTANATLVNAAAINITGQVNTATLYAATSANIASAVQANSIGIWTTGTVNGATISATATFTANSTLVNAAAINISNQTNTATLYAATSANIASVTLANASGLFVSNTVNATAFTTANSVVNTTQISIGTINSTSSGVVANTTTILIGNSSVNVSVNSTVFSGTSYFSNNATYLNGVAAENYLANSGNYTISGVHTHSANIIMSGTGVFVANGGFGTVNQVLVSNGSAMYWGDPSGIGANALYSYNWTNNHSWGNSTQQANITMSNGHLIFSNGYRIYANGGFGTLGQGLLSNGTAMYWGAAGVDVSAQYSWTNTHTFSNTITFNSSLLGNTVNATSITTTGVTVNATSVAVGANVYMTSTQFNAGNSTINATYTSAGFVVGNGTITANLGLAGVYVGANAYVSSTTHGIGNSTINATMTATGLSVANGTVTSNIGTAGVYVGANAYLTTTTHFIGNSTINAYMNSTTMFVASNSTMNTVITANQITLNGSNVVTTATALKVYNAAGTQVFP